ncbi:putative rod shape-determining protein MreC [Hyphomonas neptunium ATCC 15444]|uniref:Cell shape-determining protein MreC n=2 Tax=Hyphomonas TaxID=85 RepID=Q0BY29_HYPNA|nr:MULTISPECIES: rod shape-determining protein MreC [Hyphomonas]ABI77673.1 putative rod shape-determining protein MreC [Hyphomonas neptunium ATCC 15444]KCZ93696.1 putative rod shape-determining protein MreC [Hyphomonas hirschiana VP5]
MARFGPTGQKTAARGARRLTLGVLMAAAFALLVAQSAPQISEFFVPARTTVSDRLRAPSEISLWARITGQAERERRVRALENEVRDLARYKAAAISMADRLEAYERILNLMGEPPEKGVTARVTTEVDGPFSQTLLANAGEMQGVEPGAVAVNEGGLVGRVIHLGERSSRILLISDYSSRLPVLGEVSGVRAIMYGQDREGGRLSDLPEDADFVEGERILTSGDGGAYPRGLVVGSAGKDASGWRVRLAMRDHGGTYVRMIQPPEIIAPVAEVPPLPDEAVAEGAEGAPATPPAEAPPQSPPVTQAPAQSSPTPSPSPSTAPSTTPAPSPPAAEAATIPPQEGQ